MGVGGGWMDGWEGGRGRWWRDFGSSTTTAYAPGDAKRKKSMGMGQRRASVEPFWRIVTKPVADEPPRVSRVVFVPEIGVVVTIDIGGCLP